MIACIPDTTSPGTDDPRSSRAETETVPGRTSRESHPSEDLSELPFLDRSPNAGAVIARQSGHDLLSGRSVPLPTLLAAFMQISPHRWIFALPPMLLPILCLYKAHQRMYFSFWIFTLEGSRIRLFPSNGKVPLTTYPVSELSVAEISKNFP